MCYQRTQIKAIDVHLKGEESVACDTEVKIVCFSRVYNIKYLHNTHFKYDLLLVVPCTRMRVQSYITVDGI